MKKPTLIYIFSILIAFHLQAQNMLNYENLSKLTPTELIYNGDSCMKINCPDTALEYYIILAGKYNLNMNKANKYLSTLAYNSIGQIYYQKENYNKAFENYLKGLQICEENNFKEPLPELYKNIGNIYGVFMEYEQSINYHEKALELAHEQRNMEIEIKSLENLIGSCCFANKTEKAKLYYNKLMKYAEKDKLVKYFGYLGKARIFVNERKTDSAIIFYKKSAEYANQMKLAALYKGSSYGELAKLFENTNQNDSALYYFKLNAGFTEKSGIMYMLAENLKALVRIYKKQGDQRNALIYKELYWDLSDSLFNLNEFNRMKDIRFTYELDRNYNKIATLTTDKEQKDMLIKVQKKVLIIISISLFIFAILLVTVYIQKNKLHEAYKDLFKRNSEVLQSEKQNKELRIIYENKLAKIINDSTPPEIPNNNPPLINDKEESKNLEELNKLYSTSKLTEDSKKELLQKINLVMENPDEFCDCDFSLERLAFLVESNSRYVSQVINETYNKNFRTFINDYRIKEAQLRLIDTAEYDNYTIQAIAESVGYKSHTNFIIIFKRITGMTPSIFQKIAKEKE